MDLYKRLRTRYVLQQAWRKVRASGALSASDTTKRQIAEFDRNWPARLDRIAEDLRKKRFRFSDEKGLAIPKGPNKTGYRPIVVTPIANRIVRRALLDVMQGYGSAQDHPRNQWAGVPEIISILETATSVGGLRNKGVQHGLAIIDGAVRDGKSFFIRSDIKNFFTSIPKRSIVDFVADAVCDEDFSLLFQEALETNLANEEDLNERKLLTLFPTPEVGVAQGSALSALAGNIALNEFDQAMNGRGIVCVRYIDDFILLGPEAHKVRSAYNSARARLSQLGMDAYDLEEAGSSSSTKVASGNIHSGTDFLGYRISGLSRQPCQAATRRLMDKIDAVVTRTSQQMRRGAPHGKAEGLYQAMDEINEIVWGWSQSFRFSTTRHVMQGIDADIDERLTELQRIAYDAIALNPHRRRKLIGVTPIGETVFEELPAATKDKGKIAA